MMIDSYRAIGHQFADTDPLKINQHEKLPAKLDKSILNIN
jgi:2-oxoglutarate dehydrogenase complex dehydrogenase (E1) component-like enzyme